MAVFWWKVSSEEGGDYLKFYVDGTQLVSVVGISGNEDWAQKMVSVSINCKTLQKDS